MSTTPEMIERLNNEADLCRNDGANDIAALLTEAAGVMGKLHARERACATVNEGEIIALVRMGQELAENMGLNPLTASPHDIVCASASLVTALAKQQAEIADALHAMRAYARDNPRHEYQGQTQDPNGVHAWLARNDRA